MAKPNGKPFSSGVPRFELRLPPHGVLYFDHLEAKLCSQPDQSIDQELSTLINELRNKRKEGQLTWHDLYTLELICFRLLPPESLPREVWSLRSRYRDVAGLVEFEAYLGSKPPVLEGQVDEKALRADIEFLLGKVYLRYAVSPINQKLSDSISKRVTTVVILGLFIIASVVIANTIFNIGKLPPATLLPVLFVGAMGGLLSMQQRYQSVSQEGDLIDNISQLSQNWSRLFLPAISGSIFAAMLYMLFAAGLVQGDLFPTLPERVVDVPADGGGTGLLDLLNMARPESACDYAKLIVWAFLAGFAERFVPDTLSRFISRREAEGKNYS